MSDSFAVYEIFNRVEGLIWFGVAVFIAFFIPKQTPSKAAAVKCASLGFVLFGISDFLEAPTHGQMPAWLWILKIACVAELLACRFWYIGWKKFRFTDKYLLFAILCLIASIAIILLEKTSQ